MLAHLSALAGLVIPLIGNVLGPLLVSIARSDQSAFVAAHARKRSTSISRSRSPRSSVRS